MIEDTFWRVLINSNTSIICIITFLNNLFTVFNIIYPVQITQVLDEYYY